MGILRKRNYPVPPKYIKDLKTIEDYLHTQYRALSDESGDRIQDFDNYIPIIASPTTDSFPTITAAGELANSAYNNSTYATAGHNHSSTYAALVHTHTSLTTMGTMVVASDVTNTTQTMANVTGLSFSVAASKTYGFRFLLKGNTSASTNALWIQFTGPTSPTSFYAYVEMKTTANAYREQEELTAFSTATTYTSFGIANDHCISVEGFLVNGTNAGTVQLQFRNETAGQTVTAYRGSWGIWHLLD